MFLPIKLVKKLKKHEKSQKTAKNQENDFFGHKKLKVNKKVDFLKSGQNHFGSIVCTDISR